MKLRYVVTMLFLPTLMAALALGQEPAKKPKESKGDDESAIRAAVDSYTAAYNAADAKRLADHWSDDAVYTRPDSGEKVTGREAIQKVFEELLAADKGRRKHPPDRALNAQPAGCVWPGAGRCRDLPDAG